MHVDTLKHMVQTQYMHTGRPTQTHNKSDSCRYDGALGEGEVKA